ITTAPQTPSTPCPFATAEHAWQTKPVQATLQHTPSAQKLLAQSLFDLHALPCAHLVAQVLVAPPQSTSLSVRSFVVALAFSISPQPSRVRRPVRPCAAQGGGGQRRTPGVPPPPQVS